MFYAFSFCLSMKLSDELPRYFGTGSLDPPFTFEDSLHVLAYAELGLVAFALAPELT